MSTFTKKTAISWSPASWAILLEPGTLESPNVALNELHGKKREMIDDGKMSEGGGGFVDSAKATIFVKFIDEESAQEWINFNLALATTHNLTIISTEIKSI